MKPDVKIQRKQFNLKIALTPTKIQHKQTKSSSHASNRNI